jgi:hypothetical protein
VSSVQGSSQSIALRHRNVEHPTPNDQRRIQEELMAGTDLDQHIGRKYGIDRATPHIFGDTFDRETGIRRGGGSR